MARILSQIGSGDIIETFAKLPNTDFNSLMLKIFQTRAEKLAPEDMLKVYPMNRFSIPSALDPVAYHELEVSFLSEAKKRDITPILLSPAVPFAASSVFSCVDQNNVVSAVRGTEILSDPTNMLSIMIAAMLQHKEADNTTPIHYCTTARVLRAQVFPNTKRHFAHFGIFCIVSSGKDTGSYRCEKDLLVKQLSFYKELLTRKYDANLSVVLGKRRGYPDGDGFFDMMTETARGELPDAPVSIDISHEDNHYYQGFHYKIYFGRDENKVEIGDGGFVDWIQRMTHRKKERCLISGIGLERLLL